MLSNVQIVDEQQRALAFGDYARYWGNERKALLTRDPVVAGYDEGEQADTVFMRADSIFLYTVNRFAPPKDSLTAAADSSASDSLVRHRYTIVSAHICWVSVMIYERSVNVYRSSRRS